MISSSDPRGCGYPQPCPVQFTTACDPDDVLVTAAEPGEVRLQEIVADVDPSSVCAWTPTICELSGSVAL